MRHNEFYSTIDSANLLHQGTHNNMILNQMSAALADSGEPRAFVCMVTPTAEKLPIGLSHCPDLCVLHGRNTFF